MHKNSKAIIEMNLKFSNVIKDKFFKGQESWISALEMWLANENADINFRDSFGKTILVDAVEAAMGRKTEQRYRFLQKLLNVNGVDLFIEYKDENKALLSPLRFAIRENDDRVFDILLTNMQQYVEKNLNTMTAQRKKFLKDYMDHQVKIIREECEVLSEQGVSEQKISSLKNKIARMSFNFDKPKSEKFFKEEKKLSSSRQLFFSPRLFFSHAAPLFKPKAIAPQQIINDDTYLQRIERAIQENNQNYLAKVNKPLALSEAAWHSQEKLDYLLKNGFTVSDTDKAGEDFIVKLKTKFEQVCQEPFRCPLNETPAAWINQVFTKYGVAEDRYDQTVGFFVVETNREQLFKEKIEKMLSVALERAEAAKQPPRQFFRKLH